MGHHDDDGYGSARSPGNANVLEGHQLCFGGRVARWLALLDQGVAQQRQEHQATATSAIAAACGHLGRYASTPNPAPYPRMSPTGQRKLTRTAVGKLASGCRFPSDSPNTGSDTMRTKAPGRPSSGITPKTASTVVSSTTRAPPDKRRRGDEWTTPASDSPLAGAATTAGGAPSGEDNRRFRKEKSE
jgi:hypothetical protein